MDKSNHRDSQSLPECCTSRKLFMIKVVQVEKKLMVFIGKIIIIQETKTIIYP
jgi:hypothetical protein